MKDKIILLMKNQYKDFEIEDVIYEVLYNEAILNIDKSSANLENDCYYEMKEYIDNYIIGEIQNGNDLFQLILADYKSYVVKRYFNVKSIEIDQEYLDYMYDKIPNEKKLQKYYEDVSEMVTEAFKEDYDYDSTLDKQYIKQLNKKFMK